MTSVRTQVSGDGLGRSGQDLAQDLTRQFTRDQFSRERFGRDSFGASAGQERDVRGRDGGGRGERETGLGAADRGRGHGALADRAEQFEQVLARQGGNGHAGEDGLAGRDAAGGGPDDGSAPAGDVWEPDALTAPDALAAAAGLQSAGQAGSGLTALAISGAPPTAEAPPAGLGQAAVETLIDRIAQASRDGYLLPYGQAVQLRIPFDAGGPVGAAQVALTPHSIEIVLAPGAAGATELIAAAARDLRDRLASRFPGRRVTVDAGVAEPPAAGGGLAAIAGLLGRARGEGEP